MTSNKVMGCGAGLAVGVGLLSVAIAIAIALMEYDVLSERHATRLGAGLGIGALVLGFNVYAWVAGKGKAPPDSNQPSP